jgi:hypothetical protein
MARPNKIGLEYFPFDVDFFNDEKISAVSGEFGIKGELACIKLLCAIYRKGYFILWDEMLRMKLIKELPGVSADLLDKIVSRLVRWGFFDKALFEESGILTSNGIQRRYFEAIKRRVKVGENLPYLLVSVYNNRVSVYNNPHSDIVSVCNNAQSKVNESKYPPIIPPMGGAPPSEKFLKFKKWLSENAPRVEQLKQPFTEQEYTKIFAKWKREEVLTILVEMHNYKPLTKKNISAYLTADKWLQRRKNDEKPNEKPNAPYITD